MKAIFKREFKAYFHSFIGCLFIGAILFVTGIYVTVYDLLSGLPNISYALSGILFIFMISVPILTMRVLAEEQKQRTDQLLFTAPVPVGKAVLGKFFALAAVFTIPVLVICVYPLVLAVFGTVPLLESYVTILAFYLYGLTCIAVGVFLSSLTESQVIAAVLSFAALFVGYIMPGICNMISTTGNLLTRILGCFDMISRFDSLAGGTFDLRGVLYYITLIALSLFLTVQSIQKRRYSVSVRSLRMGAYSSTMVLAAVLADVLVNLLAAEIPTKYTTFDVTSNKLYSLTGETKELAENLTEDIQIYVLANESSQDVTLKKTLDQYAQLSGHIKVSCVDPVVNPKFYTSYTDAAVSRNSLIVVSDRRSKVIDYSTVYETSMDYTTYSSTVTGYDAEGQITGAIDYVTSDDMPKLYLLEGHGELAFETDFNDTIEKANIDYETINLLSYEAIPDDADGIVINAPTSDFSEDDTAKVLEYLKNGGNALIICTWTDKDMTNFHKILDYYEISVADGLVLEGKADSYYQSPFYILPTVEYDSVTGSVGDSYIFAPYAQGLRYPEETGDDLTLFPLLTTSDEAFARADVENSGDYTKKENDEAGPFAIGIRAVKTGGQKTAADTSDDAAADTSAGKDTAAESCALIFSSESLFTDAADVMVSGANMKLFAGALSALTKEEGGGIAIPVKSYDTGYLTVPQSNIILIGVLITVVLPFGILIAGFAVWFRRRRL